MKKNKFTEFFKGKGYYVLLFVGVIAIAAVAIIGSQLSSDKKNEDQNYVDLNDDTDDNIAANDKDTDLAENNPISEGVANNASNSDTDVATKEDAGQEVAGNKDSVEYEGYAEGSDKTTEQAQATEKADEAKAEEDKPDTVEATGKTVEAGNAATEALSFSADKGLLWPVSGNVIMNFSMDHTIYFATLMKYQCNPAIIIDAEVGTEVKAAAKGIITSIEYNEETGNTITMDIGDGFSVIYGQLNKESIAKLEVGDVVSEGDVIGTIDDPTRYYSVEGSNLYFQVMEKDQSVNPMLYLRD